MSFNAIMFSLENVKSVGAALSYQSTIGLPSPLLGSLSYMPNPSQGVF